MSISVDLHPQDLLTGKSRTDQRFLIILNQPICSQKLLKNLWNRSDYKICADGGANRLLDLFSDPPRASQFRPDLIHGDLDSLRDDVREFYQRQGVQVTQDTDQESTDFGKAVKRMIGFQYDASIEGRIMPMPPVSLIVLGSISGRVDQGIGLLHEIFREQLQHPEMTIWLVSECSVSVVLQDDATYTISGLKTTPQVFTENVGILPLYGPATITTSGLQYNVSKWKTRMGGNVSTSNHVVEDDITIEVHGSPVLFTIERSAEFL